LASLLLPSSSSFFVVVVVVVVVVVLVLVLVLVLVVVVVAAVAVVVFVLVVLVLGLVEADDDDNDDGADDADPTLHLLACWPAVGRQPLKLSFQIMPSVAVQASASHLPQTGQEDLRIGTHLEI
jgi:hypothetical protein